MVWYKLDMAAYRAALTPLALVPPLLYPPVSDAFLSLFGCTSASVVWENPANGVFGIVYFKPLAQRLIGCADARWLVDADLLGDGEVQ